MGWFDVRVIKGSGEPEALSLEASSAGEVTARMRSQGYSVLSVRPASGLRLGSRREERFPLALFSQELAVLLEAGIPLVAALSTLAENATRAPVRNVLNSLIRSIDQGLTLSTAMREHPYAFPELYVASIQSSEQTSALSRALRRYVEYQSQIDAIRRKVTSASIYPLLLLVVGTLVMLFLLFYVVPRFGRIYQDRGGDLPLFSQLLMTWGRFADEHAVLVVGGLAAVIAALAYAVMRPQTRELAQALLWREARTRNVLQVYYLSRFYRSVGMLLQGGITLPHSLEMSAGLLPLLLRNRLSAARRAIEEGQPMTAALAREQLATPVAARMMAVGETAGRMGEMLERAAAFHDEQIARWIDRFSRLFEPLLMTVIGLVIGLIVVFMYMPIFELASSFQ